jgi:hypothetical protein
MKDLAGKDLQETRVIGKLIPGFVDKMVEAAGKRALNRVYHATERYIDWK